jgi:hypothetical protein
LFISASNLRPSVFTMSAIAAVLPKSADAARRWSQPSVQATNSKTTRTHRVVRLILGAAGLAGGAYLIVKSHGWKHYEGSISSPATGLTTSAPPVDCRGEPPSEGLLSHFERYGIDERCRQLTLLIPGVALAVIGGVTFGWGFAP